MTVYLEIIPPLLLIYDGEERDLKKDFPDFLQYGFSVPVVRKDYWGFKIYFEEKELVNV